MAAKRDHLLDIADVQDDAALHEFSHAVRAEVCIMQALRITETAR